MSVQVGILLLVDDMSLKHYHCVTSGQHHVSTSWHFVISGCHVSKNITIV